MTSPHSTSVQRFKRSNPCPICGGDDNDRRGRGIRCFGFISSDGKYAHCTREEYAGGLPYEEDSSTYSHLLRGPCKCGVEHNPAMTTPRAVTPLRPEQIAYDYTDAKGALVFQVIRQPGKKFLQRRPDGKGGFEWDLKGVKRVLYRLPELVAAPASQTVYITEGEKDADTLSKLGLVATTNSGGAGKWHLTPNAAQAFLYRHVAILADNDEVGQQHALKVMADILSVAASVRIVTMPDGAKDVSDWLALGHTRSELEALVLETTPEEGENLPRYGQLFSEIEQRPIHWLWTNHMAFGKMAIVDGDPGLGKGLMGVDIAARLSRGLKLPGEMEAGQPCSVVLITPEDDPADTTKPRLAAAGADMARVVNLYTIPDYDFKSGKSIERVISIPKDLHIIEHVVMQHNAKLLIIDPVMSALDPGVKTGIDSEVRAALMPLKVMAERLGIVVLLVRHLNKGGSDKALYRGGGSIAFTGLCRTAFVLAAHPDDENKRVLAATKSNIGRKAEPWVFSIVEPANRQGAPHLEWEGQDPTLNADTIVSAGKSDERRQIIQILKEAGGELITLDDIVESLGLESDRERGALKTRLSRMVKSGEISNPSRGKYALTSYKAPVTSSLSLNTHTPVTNVTNVTNVTDVTSVTLEEEKMKVTPPLESYTSVTDGVTFTSPDNSRADGDKVTKLQKLQGSKDSEEEMREWVCPTCHRHTPAFRKDGAGIACVICDKALIRR